MKRLAMFLLLAAALTAPSPSARAQPQTSAAKSTIALDGAKIESITGLKGSLIAEENVFKVTKARSDVKVSVSGRVLEPFMGLTSWAAFSPGGKSECMVMGDLVLFADEVDPVMDALFASNLAATALHNHFFSADPPVYFMHIGGEGTQDALAKGVKAALDAVDSIRSKSPTPKLQTAAAQVPTTSSIDAGSISAILGAKGMSKDGMFKAVIGRKVQMPCGCEAGKEMGVNTWVAFAGSPDKALVDGDFVAFAGELQPVLQALRKSGISIVAIHTHMEGEKPEAMFLHYWGVGKAEDLARGVKTALDAQAKAVH